MGLLVLCKVPLVFGHDSQGHGYSFTPCPLPAPVLCSTPHTDASCPITAPCPPFPGLLVWGSISLEAAEAPPMWSPGGPHRKEGTSGLLWYGQTNRTWRKGAGRRLKQPRASPSLLGTSLLLFLHHISVQFWLICNPSRSVVLSPGWWADSSNGALKIWDDPGHNQTHRSRALLVGKQVWARFVKLFRYFFWGAVGAEKHRS